MSWIKFKEKHLLAANFALVMGIILWRIRGDFTWQPVIVIWFTLGFFFPAMRRAEKKVLHLLGKINGAILMGAFYFLALTPFSLIYRWHLRHPSFRRSDSSFVLKNDISDFTRPF